MCFWISGYWISMRIKHRFCHRNLHVFKQAKYLHYVFGLTLYILMFMFSGQLHFQANAVFMSSELQLISPSNRQDLQQLTGRESSLALPVTSRAISPLSSINLTVDIASINLAPSRLTLADLIQTAVHSLAYSIRPEHFHWGMGSGGGVGRWGWGGGVGGIFVPIWRMHSGGTGGCDLKGYEAVIC